MKNVTILTFDEVERIKQDLDQMIDEAKDGANGDQNARNTCDWLLDDLIALKSRFEEE